MHCCKKLILGGAQIGQDYGLVRKTSFETADGVQDLLTKTWNLGFDAIDTARTYGNSESIVGSLRWSGEIHTKLDEFVHPSDSLKRSLEELGRESTDLLYVCHDASRIIDVSEPYWAHTFSQLRANSRAFGAAVYTDQLDTAVLGFEEVQVIQVPFNILTPASVSERLKAYKSVGKRIYARSIFAQGLLFRAVSKHQVSSLRQALAVFNRVCREVDLYPPELAFRWALRDSVSDGLVLGFSKFEEVSFVSQWLESGPLDSETFDYVEESLGPYRYDIDLRSF